MKLRYVPSFLLCVAFLTLQSSNGCAASPSTELQTGVGTVHVPAFDMPLSKYMSEEARKKFIQNPPFAGLATLYDHPNPEQQRELVNRWFNPRVERARAVYPVAIEARKFAGIRTQVVVPTDGVSVKNKDIVLINLHGGSYLYASGGGLAGLMEAIPIAGVGKIRVVTVDYRTSPKSRFPSAILDVTAVYKELLKEYEPSHVGIYGCSTGATLTANVVSWLQAQKIPLPGAIGMFCGGATKDDQIEGDSYYLAPAAMGDHIPEPGAPFPSEPYMDGTDGEDPLVAPVVSLDVLSRFPPSLLISGTRDVVLSAAVYTHTRLIKAGVDADLHVWDGMWHAFFFDVDLPESKEAYSVISNFFERHLRGGKTSADNSANSR